MATIEHMTLEELQRLIDTRIDARLGQFELDEDSATDADMRTWEQVQADIERDRWTPPPGAKSALELLREDRES